jgi:uncharacterized repeat protein (TIGR03803 family)
MAKCISAVFLLCVAASIAVHAQTFTSLVNFDGPDGQGPYAPLVQGLDGNLYGTTSLGGDCFGTVFNITPQGKLTALTSFCTLANAYPYAGLTQTSHGDFYGIAEPAVFKITPEGVLTTINSSIGASPADGEAGEAGGGVVLATDGNLYGTGELAEGTLATDVVFKLTPQGTLTTLHSFCSQPNCTDGSTATAGVIQATDGNFYGTTSRGGASSTCNTMCGSGTVFKITPEGTMTTLYSFCAQPNCTDGSDPVAGLVQGTDGNFYGTTVAGGANAGVPGGTAGTVFKITPAGQLTTLYSFCSLANCADGDYPEGGLIQATDGNFYGTTNNGGLNYSGTVFKITPQGELTTLYQFCTQTNCTDGRNPYAGLVQATTGDFYGTTVSDGGTVFRLSVGLGRFVETLPVSGAVGNTIDILGQDLTGTTAVSFNGIAAEFTVVSDTYLTATIPGGATTGFVTVTTPTATVKSNQKFRVTP